MAKLFAFVPPSPSLEGEVLIHCAGSTRGDEDDRVFHSAASLKRSILQTSFCDVSTS